MAPGEVRLAAVGDLMVGDSAISVGFGFGSRYDDAAIADLALRVRPLLQGAEIAVGNLECVLSREGFRADDWRSAQMRGRPSYAAALRRAGFTHLGLANNHAMQHGTAAFEDTVALLRHAGIEPLGLAGTDGWTSRPAIFEAADDAVGLLAYCLRPRQYGHEIPPYA